jgi:hypothetical protein
MRRIASILICCAACAPPPVVPSADHANDGPLGVIKGDVIFSGTARGNVILLLYEASMPPLPAGTGRPVNFTVIDESTLFNGASGLGPFSAPYAFGPVAAGVPYLIAAFLDADLRPASHGPDFVPWYSVTDEPGAGDVLGGYVNVSTDSLTPVEVPVVNTDGGEVLGGEVDDVSVIMDQSPVTTEPLDRPSFCIWDPTCGACSANTSADLSTNPTMLVLGTYTIHVDPIFAGAPFVLSYVNSGNGTPAMGPNGPLFWPAVLVRKVDPRDPTGLHDENDLANTGYVSPIDPACDSVQYVGADPNPNLPPAVILAAGIVPTMAELQALNNPRTGMPDATLSVPVPQLALAIERQALDIKCLNNPQCPAGTQSQPVPLAMVPSGRYAITVEQFTLQTWRLPNEMEACPPTQTCPDLIPSDPTQGFMLVVPP